MEPLESLDDTEQHNESGILQQRWIDMAEVIENLNDENTADGFKLQQLKREVSYSYSCFEASKMVCNRFFQESRAVVSPAVKVVRNGLRP